MGHMPAGGLICSGVGGCAVAGNVGTDLSGAGWTESGWQSNGVNSNDNMFLDVARWELDPIYVWAECPHSGTWGAMSRRLVIMDFRFSLAIPYDYDNAPDLILFPNTSYSGAETISLRLNLADVKQEPLLKANNAEQQYYLAPSACIERTPLVLNAAGDVIRQQITGAGNGLLFHMPFEEDDYKAYMTYMQSRGWQV